MINYPTVKIKLYDAAHTTIKMIFVASLIFFISVNSFTYHYISVEAKSFQYSYRIAC